MTAVVEPGAPAVSTLLSAALTALGQHDVDEAAWLLKHAGLAHDEPVFTAGIQAARQAVADGDLDAAETAAVEAHSRWMGTVHLASEPG